MALWLFKEEPSHYSFTDLEADGRTTWTGVRNAQALNYLRSVAVGDRVFFYHTGKEKAVVGEMRISQFPPSPPEDVPAVEVVPVRRLAQPVSLARIKADPAFAGWELVRLPRLSVMPVSPEQWQRVEELARL